MTVLVNIVLEVQDDAVSTGEEIKDVKEEWNRDMAMFIENPKESTSSPSH